jgi:hypothetical protein
MIKRERFNSISHLVGAATCGLHHVMYATVQTTARSHPILEQSIFGKPLTLRFAFDTGIALPALNVPSAGFSDTRRDHVPLTKPAPASNRLPAWSAASVAGL